MKIAIDISQLVHEGTGITTYTDQLVRNLLKIDRQNEYVLFGISFRKYNRLLDYFAEIKSQASNATCQFFHIPPTIGEFFWNRLHRIKIENLIGNIDIFHSSDWIQPPAMAKKITTVHDTLIYKLPYVSHSYIIETQKRRMKWVKEECDVVMTDAQATKEELVQNLNFDQDKIEVVYPGLSEKFTPASREQITAAKQKYALLDNYILAVGTIEPRKNLKGIISAFEQFQKHTLVATRKEPLELVIVGKFGWGEKPKSDKYIKLLGYVDGKDLPILYSGALMFVYPSFHEGFGFPVLEAMACGCPVITSNRGSLQEIVGNSALLVDPELPEDITVKMAQIFVDKTLRAELIRKGIENAKKFTWEKTAGEVLSIYKKLYK